MSAGSQAAATVLAGSPDSSESIAAATSDNTSAPGRATQFSGNSATPSTSFTRDIRKDPIPAPGAEGSQSNNSQPAQPAAAPASQQQPQSSANPASSNQHGNNSGKSMFDETPEEAATKKDFLKKLSSGNKDVIEQYKQQHKDDPTAQHINTSKPVNSAAQMDVEQWGDSKDPVYNSTAAAKDDYYTPAKDAKEEEEEDVTVAATKLLLTDPTKIAQAAKQAEAK